MFRLKFTLIIHLLGWLLFWALPFFYMSQGTSTDFDILVSRNYLLFIGVYLTVFYLNTLFLIPKLYFQKHYLLYFGIFAIMLIVVSWLKPYDNLIFQKFNHFSEQRILSPSEFHGQYRPEPPHEVQRRPPFVDIVSIFLFFTIWMLGMAITVALKWQLTEKKAVQAEADKVTAELSFLKAQINPHFLFNTLNNIYTLATMNHENTAPSIMKLSHIMRYVTDEITEDFVPLSSEIACISDYIDLQKLRLTPKTSVCFEVNGEVGYREIAPLILMTFVENAFKHAVSNREESAIMIKILGENNTIKFSCQNTLFTQARKVERTGIGIQNTKKRLEYSYPERHSLTISQENGLYMVELFLQN
ncbi:histidine kinase [Arcicella sp. LKC2W]|uniref:sensor histidine kinase n=1 Tax=Arcicella sp. LKC2W TaxID=2984198 RepID=UPI002B1EC0DB|nr:histidine kinase [Arcicella sp. LKC2W]MEA5458824.1 histidine kinase [Arcicella sp. LKC2W]